MTKLRSLMHSIETSHDRVHALEADLADTTDLAVEEYRTRRVEIQRLCGDMKRCDGILETIETSLSQFQSNLNGLSGRINELQDETSLLYVQLQNRKGVEGDVSSYVKNLHFTPDDIRRIENAPIDRAYIRTVDHLCSRLEYLDSGPVNHVMATTEVAAGLHVVKKSAEARIRAHMLKLIGQIKRRGDGDAREALSQLQPLYVFIRDFCHDDSVRSAYCDTASKTISTSIKAHLKDFVAVKDGRASPDTLTTRPAPGPARSSVDTVLGLGTQERYLYKLGTPDAVLSGRPTTFAEGWLSALHVFASLCRTEATFVNAFFRPRPRPVMECIVGAGAARLTKALGKWLAGTTDIAGVAVAAAGVAAVQRLMFTWRVAGVDPILDEMRMMVWPVFKRILNRHMDSLGCLGESVEVGTPYYVVQRYSQLTHTLVCAWTVHPEAFVVDAVAGLRDALDRHLHMAAQGLATASDRAAFFIVNYGVILDALDLDAKPSFVEPQSPGVTSPGMGAVDLLDGMVQYYSSRLDANSGAYAGIALNECIPDVIKFVSSVESVGAADFYDYVQKATGSRDPEAVKREALEEIEKVCLGFTGSWRHTVTQLADRVGATFRREQGDMVFKTIMGQLLKTYDRLLNLAAQSRLPHLQGRGMLASGDIVAFARQALK